MLNRFSRTQLILGKEAMEKLKNAHVAVFGIGGVGGYVCEALVRSGVGSFDLIDDDKICLTNLNRQIIATTSTIGKYKADVMKARMEDINPQVKVQVHKCFFLPENASEYDLSACSYIVDAVDTVAAKLSIIQLAIEQKIPVISCMGAGNKLDPTRFEVSDISRTSVCPLARVIRRELKKRAIEHCKVVYSQEPALSPAAADEALPAGSSRRTIPGSVSFVPSAAGLVLAGEVIKDLAFGQSK